MGLKRVFSIVSGEDAKVCKADIPKFETAEGGSL